VSLLGTFFAGKVTIISMKILAKSGCKPNMKCKSSTILLCFWLYIENQIFKFDDFFSNQMSVGTCAGFQFSRLKSLGSGPGSSNSDSS
jgi:hypothetical protein